MRVSEPAAAQVAPLPWADPPPAPEPDIGQAARLAALASYDILDTPREAGFDDIALLASQFCAAPIALVSLVANDRQWFKASVGFDVCGTPLSDSVCRHALGQPGLLVIANLATDPRTRDNTLVGGPPGLRFYAGAPLETPQGEILGTLCVLDMAPRPQGLTQPQAHALAALARQVMVLLELRRSVLTMEARVADQIHERSRTWQVSPDLMGVLNADAVFEASNPAWQTMLGWSEAELGRRVFFDFLHPDDMPANRISWADALRGTPVLNLENRYRHKDGTYRWLSWVAVPEGSKVYCTGRDVTAEKAQSAALGASTAELMTERQAARLREEFIAVLGHDLRNPLASLAGGLRLLGSEVAGERATLVLRHMQQSIHRMSGLIDNVLDFARGRLGGGVALNLVQDGALADTLAHVVNELRTAWPGRTIEARLDIRHPVRCDAARIGQLLSNLLGNAVTHGAAATPIRVDASADADHFKLSVANEGAPIPAGAIAGLFQPFFRGATRASEQGLGLGLYIVSEIARAHGGTVDVASTPAETRFTFEMPNGLV